MLKQIMKVDNYSCSLPRSDRFIKENIQALLKRKWKGKYRTNLDMVLCNLFPAHRPDCVSFYKGEGEDLEGLYSKAQLRFLDSTLFREIKKCVN